MATIGETARAYEPERMKNIADLEVVTIDIEFKKEERINKTNNEKYNVSFITIDNVEYRVPASVLEQLQVLLEEKPEMKGFKVKKSGEGMNTKYQVIAL